MICRMCILDSMNVIKIFDGGPSKYKIADTIFQHFKFQPLRDDPITNVICASCWDEIKNFHEFYLKVEDAQKKYKTLQLEATATGERPLNNSVEIKKECEVQPYEAIVIKDEHSADLNAELKHEEEVDALGENLEKNQLENIGFIDEDFVKTKLETDSSEYSEKDFEEKINSEDETDIELPSDGEDSDKEWRHAPTKKRGKRGRKPLPEGLKKRTRTNKLAIADAEIAKHTNLKCDLCMNVFQNFTQLIKHFRSVHKIRGYHVCCDTKIWDRPSFLQHITKHIDPDQLRCKECNKTYATKLTLQNHINIRHPPPDAQIFKCDKCPRTYSQLYLIKKHAKCHEQDKDYPCEECGKVYKSEIILRYHRRNVHENANTFMCDICAKTIKTKQLFEEHKKQHEGIEDQMEQCKICGNWYKNARNLRRHMRNHESEELSQRTCDQCGKVSASSRALKRHIKVVHEAIRRHKCTVCGKAFLRLLNLKEHMTTHTGGVLYSCQHCTKTLNSISNMHAHVKKMHRQEWEESKMKREKARTNFSIAAEILKSNS